MQVTMLALPVLTQLCQLSLPLYCSTAGNLLAYNSEQRYHSEITSIASQPLKSEFKSDFVADWLMK